MDKKCIFHIPNRLSETGNSGSQIRPRKMIQALRDIGYDVDVIMGEGKERKSRIKEIEDKIKKGVIYDFVYSESSTMPTLLTEKHHLPTYPTLDFGFFKYCRKHGIPIGLFYRDIYWKFPIYREKVTGLKYLVSCAAYKYDLYQYQKYLDVFFVPSKGMLEHIDNEKLKSISVELPPGCDYDEQTVSEKDQYYSDRRKTGNRSLNLFYVGGINNQYILDEFLKAVNEMDNIHLTLCCREDEWRKEKARISQYLNSTIEVVHKSGLELNEYYQNTDICVACFKPDAYRKMAVPIKLFEYLAHTVPVLATNHTALGEYVSDNHVGWSVEYSKSEIKKLLSNLLVNYEDVIEKHNNCVEQLSENAWNERARFLSSLLKKREV